MKAPDINTQKNQLNEKTDGDPRRPWVPPVAEELPMLHVTAADGFSAAQDGDDTFS